MKLQYRLSNGKYISCEDRDEEFLLMAIEYTKKTRDEIVSLLESGKEISTGDDWYSSIRSLTFHKKLEAEMEKRMEDRYNSFVLCDCGHSVAPLLVMGASMGSSCPDCYDDMSD